LSSPIIAFCTVFEQQDNQIERVQLRQLPFAKQPQKADKKQIDEHRSQDLLEQRQGQVKHAAKHAFDQNYLLMVSGA
jgi:hypothetical protein